MKSWLYSHFQVTANADSQFFILRVIGCPSFGMIINNLNNNKMSKFKTEIKIATSSKSKLVFVKVPDSLNDLSVNNTSNNVTGTIATMDGTERWTSEKIPNQFCKFMGYSHKLTDEEIESIFSSRAEFYQMCNHHEILYNYSAYTGKWAVLAVA